MKLQRIWSYLAVSCLGMGIASSVVHAAPDPPAPPSTPPTPAKPKNTGVPISSLTGAIDKVIKSATSDTSDTGIQNSDVHISYTIDSQTKKLLLESAKVNFTVHAKDKASAEHLIQHEMNQNLAGLRKTAPGQKFTVTHLKTTVKTSSEDHKSTAVMEECTFDIVPK